MDIKPIKEAAELMEQATKILSGGPLSFYLDQMLGTYEFVMETLCPFKVGDRVQLTHTPDITGSKAPGWMHCKHFLVKGAAGEVKSSSCDAKGFYFDVVFDDESWLNPVTNQVTPTEKKHAFSFRRDSLTSEVVKASPEHILNEEELLSKTPFYLEPRDLEISTFRSGPNSGFVNRADTCCRITHKPTGLVVEKCEERSIHKARAEAMRELSGLVYEFQKAGGRPERIVGYTSRKALDMLEKGDLTSTVISKTHDADTVPVYTKD